MIPNTNGINLLEIKYGAVAAEEFVGSTPPKCDVIEVEGKSDTASKEIGRAPVNKALNSILKNRDHRQKS